MKKFFEWIINLIYKGATGTKRIRMILTPVGGFIFFCIVLLLMSISFYLDHLWGLPAFISKPFSIAVSIPFFDSGCLFVVMVHGKILENKRDSRADQSAAKTGYRGALRLFTQSDDDGSFYGNGRDWYFIWFNNAHIYHNAAVCFDEHS